MAEGWTLSLDAENTGSRVGDEVVQVYLTSKRTKVVRPVKELVAYRRVSVPGGGCARVTLDIPERVTWYYDADMDFGPHGGEFTLLVGTSAEDTAFSVGLE